MSDKTEWKFPEHICGANNLVLISPIRPEEICTAGTQIALNPHTAYCGHTYCGNVLHALRTKNITKFNCIGESFEEPNSRCGKSIEVCQLRLDTVLNREINAKKVKCSNARVGCGETVKVKKLAKHIENECQFGNPACEDCGKLVERGTMLLHAAECKLKSCEFKTIGCQQVSRISDANNVTVSELDHNQGVHMALLYQQAAETEAIANIDPTNLNSAIKKQQKALENQKQLLKMIKDPEQARLNRDKLSSLLSDVPAMGKEVKDLQLDTFHLSKQVYPGYIEERVKKLANDLSLLERQQLQDKAEIDQHSKEVQEAQQILDYGSVMFKVSNFSEKRAKVIQGVTKDGFYGPKFYSHPYGYLLEPHILVNGYSDAEGTHLSVFLTLLQGPYDALLTFPLKATFRVKFVNQSGEGTNRTVYMDTRGNLENVLRSTNAHPNPPAGVNKALQLHRLEPPSKFLKDDTLMILFSVDLY